MKKLFRLSFVCLVGSFVVASVAGAGVRASHNVSASLTAGAEVPKPVGAAGASGTFSATYVTNKSGAVLKWKLSFSKLTGPATAAHIHSGKPGVAGAVIVPLCGPCKSGQSGTTNISKTVVATLQSGGAYVNVHTTKNAGGEIRGQAKVTG